LAEDAFPISGNIDPAAFPFLMMELHRQGATGSLKVEGPTYQKALYFRGGRILFGSSNDPKDQLGSILIESGKITPEQLEDVNTKVGPGNPLAKVLAESGFVSQRELSDAARAKVERILSDVLSYDTGAFDFEDGVLPKGAVDLKLATDKLVLASVRRLSDRGFVLRHLEGLDAVLTPGPDAASRLAEVQSEAGHLLEHIDGRRTLKEAAAAARLDEFEAGKIACGLLFLGLVQRPAAALPPAELGFSMMDDAGGLDLGQTARAAFTDQIAPQEPPTLIDEEPLDPAAFVLSESETPDPETRPRGAELDTLFIEPEPPPADPSAPTPRAPEPAELLLPPLPLVPPPQRPGRTPSDTNPGSPMSEIRLPSLGDAGFEAAGAEALPKPKPPSREDLAALDALLNSRGTEGPLTPLEKPREVRWEPRLGQTAGRPHGRPASAGSRVVPSIIALLLTVTAAGVVWYQFFRAPSTPVQMATVPSPITTTTTTMPAVLAPPEVLPTPEAAASPSAEVATPPTTLAAVAPSAPSTIATTLPPATRPSAAPPAPSRPTNEGSLTDARTALMRGDFSQAARGFAANLRGSSKGAYSLQLLVACSDETVQKAAHNVASQELFILPVEYKGRSCYRVCWGVYDSESRARSAVREVPDYFRKGGASPKAVAAANILP